MLNTTDGLRTLPGGSPLKKSRHSFPGMRQRKAAFFGFIAPAVILFTVFFFVPLLLSVAFSFTNFDGWKTMDFIGFRNYSKLFADKKFFNAMGRTLAYTGLTLPLKVIVPLGLAALLVHSRVRLISVSPYPL